MAGYLPYSEARAAAAAQRPRQRPWSPHIDDGRGTGGRDIEAFLAHASHGWAAEQADQRQNAEHGAGDDLFSRHRNAFRGRREPSSDHNYGYDYTYPRGRNERREASDVSVEALDLADYAMTLRRQGPDWDPYPSYEQPGSGFQRPFSREPAPTMTAPTLSSGRRRREQDMAAPPPSAFTYDRIFSPNYLAPPPGTAPPLDRPFSALSQDTTRPPPSLISAGATSQSSHIEPIYPPPPSSSRSPQQPSSLRRPQSLPVDFLPPRWPAIFSPPPVPSSPHQTTRNAPPVSLPDPHSNEADISDFPPWARGWYDNRDTHGPRKDLQSPVYSAESGFYAQSAAAGSQRDLLPWSGNANADDRVPEDIKAERLRMLEREFGGKDGHKGLVEDDGHGLVGTVNEQGKLITAGPKRRITVRVFQGLFAFGTAASGIYGAVFIKSPNPPPPAGKPPAFVMYIFSCITFFAVIYMYGLRPCLGRRKAAKQNNMTNPAGMMVFPVAAPTQGKKGKKKKGKKGGAGENGSVQVNLIVDPAVFGTMRGNAPPGAYESEEEEGEASVAAGEGTGRRRQGPPRRSFFQSMKMEEQWKLARSQLKMGTVFDVLMTVLWIGAFILVLIGQRCPNDPKFNGWCAAYNWATAGSCLLAVMFAISIFFDAKDLRDSRISPRTRTQT